MFVFFPLDFILCILSEALQSFNCVGAGKSLPCCFPGRAMKNHRIWANLHLTDLSSRHSGTRPTNNLLMSATSMGATQVMHPTQQGTPAWGSPTHSLSIGEIQRHNPGRTALSKWGERDLYYDCLKLRYGNCAFFSSFKSHLTTTGSNNIYLLCQLLGQRNLPLQLLSLQGRPPWETPEMLNFL